MTFLVCYAGSGLSKEGGVRVVGPGMIAVGGGWTLWNLMRAE